MLKKKYLQTYLLNFLKIQASLEKFNGVYFHLFYKKNLSFNIEIWLFNVYIYLHLHKFCAFSKHKYERKKMYVERKKKKLKEFCEAHN